MLLLLFVFFFKFYYDSKKPKDRNGSLTVLGIVIFVFSSFSSVNNAIDFDSENNGRDY